MQTPRDVCSPELISDYSGTRLGTTHTFITTKQSIYKETNKGQPEFILDLTFKLFRVLKYKKN
jgi:hypothetical protein